MALTYNDLKTEVASYLHRSNLTSKIPGFITRGENELNRRLPDLSGMEALVVVTLTSGATNVPLTAISTTLNKILRVWRSPTGMNPTEIPYMTQQQLLDLREDITPGAPQYFTAQRDVMRFNRPADQTYTDIVAHITNKMALATISNVVAEDYEEAYLYAALKQAEPFIKNDGRIALWSSMLDEVVDQILQADRHRRGAQNAVLIPEITRYMGRRRSYDIRSG